MVGRTRGRVNVLRAKPMFTPSPNRHAGSASRSERIPGIEMPRECPPLFVSNPQPPELIQPSEGPFDYPSPSPQPATMFGVALRKKRGDVADAQTSPDRLRVVTTVAQYAIRTMPWMSSPSLQAWDGIN